MCTRTELLLLPGCHRCLSDWSFPGCSRFIKIQVHLLHHRILYLAGSSVDDAVASGTISRDEGELRLLRGRKKASLHHFENLAATNPDLAADMINRGELDGYFSAAEQDEMMRSLRRQDDNRLTEVVEQTASRPKSKNDRQAVTNALLSGPVYQEELGFHAVYERDGDYSACAPQIDSFIYRVADMVRAGEEGPDCRHFR